MRPDDNIVLLTRARELLNLATELVHELEQIQATDQANSNALELAENVPDKPVKPAKRAKMATKKVTKVVSRIDPVVAPEPLCTPDDLYTLLADPKHPEITSKVLIRPNGTCVILSGSKFIHTDKHTKQAWNILNKQDNSGNLVYLNVVPGEPEVSGTIIEVTKNFQCPNVSTTCNILAGTVAPNITLINANNIPYKRPKKVKTGLEMVEQIFTQE